MDENSIHDAVRHELINKEIFEQAKQYAYEYIDAIPSRRVFPSGEALDQLSEFDEPLPELPRPAEEVLRQLHQIGSPATVAQTGGRYFGYVNGNIIPAALAARWLSDTWDQNAALYIISPAAAKLERICQQMCRSV